MNSMMKHPLSEAETQHLLEDWIRARSAIWSALYGITAAHAPLPWSRFLDLTAEPYAQMFESALKVQAAGVGSMLWALQINPCVALWIEGVRRFTEAATDVQRKSGEALAALYEPSPAARPVASQPAAGPATPDVAWRSGTDPERRGQNRAFAKKPAARSSS
jgi:hypothetical protein